MADGQIIVRGAWALAHDDVTAGILQVLSLSVALATIADDGDGFAFEKPQIGVLVVVNLSRHLSSSFCRFQGRQVKTPFFVRGILSTSLAVRRSRCTGQEEYG